MLGWKILNIYTIFCFLITTICLFLQPHSQGWCWCGSSVGRAKDWKSLCRRFDPAPHHKRRTEKFSFFYDNEFFVYILYSPKAKKSYVGFTSNLEERLIFHNTSDNTKSYTSRFRPWAIAYHKTFKTKSDAMNREKWFKTGVGRELKQKILIDFLKT